MLVPWLTCFAPGLQAREEKRVVPFTRIASGQGMVMMRLITNRELSNFSPKWDKFDVHDVKTGKEYELADLYDHGHHATFLKSLPPGEYQADAVRVGDPVWQSLGEHGRASLGPTGAWRFKVEAGRMTNLGSLVYLQLYAPTVPLSPSGSRHIELRSRWVHFADDTLPQRNSFLYHPDDHPAVLSKSLGWTSIAPDATPNALPAGFRRMTLSLSGAAPAIAGGTLFGEHLGQIAWRHPGGEWTWEDTGTIESIRMAADAPDGTRYAAAEGSMLLRRSGPGDWRRIPFDIEDATPCLLHALADNSVLTVWEQFQKFTALRYRPGGDPAWTKEWEIPAPRDKARKYLGLCKGVQGRTGIVISSQMILFAVSTRRYATLDFATSHWVHHEEGIKGAIGLLPDGRLFSMTGGQSNQTFKVSDDAGKTWQNRSTGTNLLSQPLFRTPDEGFALGVVRDVSWTLFQTNDGGRNWRAITKLPNWTYWFLVLPGQEMLVATESGQLHSSRDNGRSWRLERDANAGF